MRFVEETDGKSFVQVNDGTKKEEKEYASKGVVVTGYGSYNPCACAPAATTPAA